ncbi:hypothetical protein BH24CHL5_BH24CHL5_03580 [soil metagenome]
MWGLGHLAIGDRRGWLLLVLQPLTIALVLLVAVQLIDGTRWLVALPPLVALIVLWLGQAVHAYQQALDHGWSAGGELQVAWFLPLAAAMLTAFWLLGGKQGSPSATVQGYVDAWIAARPDVARQYFRTPPAPDAMAQTWTEHGTEMRDGLTRALARYGPVSGIDPAQPFDSLRFREAILVRDGREHKAMVGELVRSQRVETTVLGVIPTAGQQTVVVEPALIVWLSLERQPAPTWLPIGWLDSYAWKIAAVEHAAGLP